MQVKCFRQETPHTCAVACLRMVLEYYGVSHDEAFLANLCETTKDGTTARSVVRAAHSLGFNASFCEGDLRFLQNCLDDEMPLIVFLSTGPLNEIPGDSIHAVVVTAMDPEKVIVNEPASGGELNIALDSFLDAWEETFFLAILVTPSTE